MISVRNITVRFDAITVLDRISLSIPDDGLTYLSGPSGRGKTTLLRVLAGLPVPDAGSVSLPGRPVLLFQEDRLFPGRTALQQVEAVLTGQRRCEAIRWLELAELAASADLLPEELSGGMARRVSLARALAVEGDVLLLDEPFAGVDLPRAERILTRIKSLHKPVILTGHTPELARLCDHILEL